jgi:hypothetical protein
MEESAAIKSANVGINEDYFEQVCASFPVLKEMRQQQKTVVGSRFESFLLSFQKFRESSYEPTSEKRYEYLFNIIEMGNFVDTMGNSKELHKIFSIIKNYRNVISDGFHAFSPEMSDQIVRSFFNLLRTFDDQDALKNFKESFQRVARGENTFVFLNEGSPDEQKIKIVRLLSQIKYFFEKVKLFVEMKNLNAASLAYIAGATCARNFTWFFCEKEKRARRLDKLELAVCKGFFSAERFAHIKNVLEVAENLIEKRRIFAHQMLQEEKVDAEGFLTGRFLASYQEVFVGGLYLKLNQYLQREYGAELLLLVEGSPRAYEPEKIKKREAVAKNDGTAAVARAAPLDSKARKDDRDEREKERRRDAEREERRRDEREREEREARREKERREYRDRRDRDDRRDEDDDRERRHHGPGSRRGK